MKNKLRTFIGSDLDLRPELVAGKEIYQLEAE